MKRKANPDLTDVDNPEWTKADVARANTFDELPASLQATLSARRRGRQKAPTKVRTSLRLSPEVVEHFKSSGSGWQTRIDSMLLKLIAKPAVSSRARTGKSLAKSARKATSSKMGAKRGASRRKR